MLPVAQPMSELMMISPCPEGFGVPAPVLPEAVVCKLTLPPFRPVTIAEAAELSIVRS